MFTLTQALHWALVFILVGIVSLSVAGIVRPYAATNVACGTTGPASVCPRVVTSGRENQPSSGIVFDVTPPMLTHHFSFILIISLERISIRMSSKNG